MKNLKVLLLVIVVLSSVQMSAFNNDPNVTPEQKLRNEIAVLLESPEIKLENNELIANIQFILNEKKEIVILTVDSEKEAIENYVKSRLNYQKIDFTANSPEENKVYYISLKVLKPLS